MEAFNNKFYFLFIDLMMFFRRLIVITFFFPIFLNAQSVLRGKVFRAEDELGLTGVSVVNMNTKKAAVSRPDGSYSIEASEGELVTFFSLGYKVDTVKVEFELLRSGYDAYLIDVIKTLSTVTVTGDYRKDSTYRRDSLYWNVYNRQTKITGGNTPEAGFGIVLSPVSYFSKLSKQTRKLKKRLKQQEEDYYINYVFPEGWVSSVTGLKGDTLKLFMYQYRPSYKFARQSDRQTLLLYIMDKYKEFIDPAKNGKK